MPRQERQESPITAAPSRPRLALAVICVAPFMVALDANVVTVALPAIRAHFHMSQTALAWVVSANALAFGGLLLAGGRAADRYGRRRMLIRGLALFVLGCLACGLALTQPVLLAARAVQGIGAALAFPAALSLLTTTFPEGTSRNRALAAYGAILAAGLLSAVALGGILTDLLGWRAAFAVNVPLGLLGIFGAARLLPAHRPPPGRLGADLPTAAAATGALVAALYALTHVQSAGWLGTATALPFAVSVVLAAGAVAINHRSRQPLFPRELVRHRELLAAAVAALFTVGTGVGTLVILSLDLQELRGLSPTQAGLLLTALGVAGIVAGRACPALVHAYGVRNALVLALVVQGVGILVVSTITADRSLVVVAIGLAVMGAGHFAANTLFVALGTTNVSTAMHGVTVGVINAAQQVGAGLGLALLVTISSARTAALRPAAVAVGAGYQLAMAAAASLVLLAAVLVLLLTRPHREATTNDHA